MEAQNNILMVEGTFEDQIIEIAQYLDARTGKETLAPAVTELVQQEKREEALEQIVAASGALSTSPEREYIPSYNLLIHLVRSSENFDKYLPTILENVSTPPTTSPHNGPALSVSVLSTLYNVLPVRSHQRYPVYLATLKVVGAHGLYDQLVPHLKKIETWVSEWSATVEEIRALYATIATIALTAEDHQEAYSFYLKALETFPSDGAHPEAHDIAVSLVKLSINVPTIVDFDELAACPGVAALQNSEPILFQLFEVFAGGQLEDYIEFNDEHEGWLENNGINHDVAYRKIRLLTLASLAASCPDRSLPYNTISRRLHVPDEDVELWVIDVIRAGLVEGKLSQLNQTFLIHRASSRNFSREQWEEVGERLDVWKQSLQGILQVIKAGREQARLQEERDQQKIEDKLAGRERRGGRRGDRGEKKQQQQQQQQQQEPKEVEAEA